MNEISAVDAYRCSYYSTESHFFFEAVIYLFYVFVYISINFVYNNNKRNIVYIRLCIQLTENMCNTFEEYIVRALVHHGYFSHSTRKF